jgi:beta-glucanase (GH16 family)
MARLSTSAGAGVVTAFILLSDAKDEIDFEFVGVELTTAQTNFYSQGVVDCELAQLRRIKYMLTTEHRS